MSGTLHKLASPCMISDGRALCFCAVLVGGPYCCCCCCKLYCMCCIQGELWDPKDRLVYDWGFAGYNGGSMPPTLPVKVNLKAQFGAKGDGYTDDTQALTAAIDSITSGVIYMSAGGQATGHMAESAPDSHARIPDSSQVPAVLHQVPEM